MNIKESAKVFKALSHPVRLQIVCGLLKKEICNVGSMADGLKLAQPTVSQHLSILKNAGIIVGNRKGTSICYSIGNKEIKELIKSLHIENA